MVTHLRRSYVHLQKFGFICTTILMIMVFETMHKITIRIILIVTTISNRIQCCSSFASLGCKLYFDKLVAFLLAISGGVGCLGFV